MSNPTGNMTKTDKYAYFYNPCFGWYNLKRRIFKDENGNEFVKLNGTWTGVNWIIQQSEWYNEEHE